MFRQDIILDNGSFVKNFLNISFVTYFKVKFMILGKTPD